MNNQNYVVIGVESVNYISKKTGKRVQGVSVYCGKSLDERGGKGYKVDLKYFDRYGERDRYFIGQEVVPLYDRFGNVSELKVIE